MKTFLLKVKVEVLAIFLSLLAHSWGMAHSARASIPDSPPDRRRAITDIERHEEKLIEDMRRLRRHMRHGADPNAIAREREIIRQDWADITRDRSNGIKMKPFDKYVCSSES